MLKYVLINYGDSRIVIMKKVIAAISALLVLAALCFCFYIFRDDDVYGHKFTLDRRSVEFDGGEIDNLSGLIAALKKFPFLESADLGTFMVDAEEEAQLKSELPDVDFRYGTYVIINGNRFSTDVEVLYLADEKIRDLGEIESLLPYFDKLKTVDLGENAFPKEDVDRIRSEYPDTEFDLVTIYDIFGAKIKDNATSVDLRKIEVDDSVISELELLPNLKIADFRGRELDAETQLKLVEKFPDVTFLWEVEIGGEKYNSTIYELDFSNCTWITAEEVKTKLPLFPNLTRLDMSDCGATNEEMAEIRDAFPRVKVVWVLHMGQWWLKTDDVAFSVLIVNYKHKRLTSQDIEVLKYCTDLRALDLGHQALTDISVIGEYLTELRVLILADNAISDLSPLTNLKHLHYLEFFVNRVNDLSPLAELHELVDLNISYNYWISDIEPLMDLPMLERLWLESTSVSKANVERLRERYPYATIINEGEGSVDKGWRSHPRYWAMMNMWYNNEISELFTRYDGED